MKNKVLHHFYKQRLPLPGLKTPHHKLTQDKAHRTSHQFSTFMLYQFWPRHSGLDVLEQMNRERSSARLWSATANTSQRLRGKCSAA